MRKNAFVLFGILFLVGGCKEAARQPGPVIALYQKDGGPDYHKAEGAYDAAVVDKFFLSRPELHDSFVGKGGVCSQLNDVADEAKQNSMICQSVISANMKRTMMQNYK